MLTSKWQPSGYTCHMLFTRLWVLIGCSDCKLGCLGRVFDNGFSAAEVAVEILPLHLSSALFQELSLRRRLIQIHFYSL
jgi:hypothetical protein